MARVVAIGELLIDSITENGIKTNNPGGAPANFLCTIQSLGIDTALLSKVGNDDYGRFLIEKMKEYSVSVSGVVKDENVATTVATVNIDENGDRHFVFLRDPGADTCLKLIDIDFSLFDDCEVLHFGSLSLTNEPSSSTTKEVVKYAKSKGKIISFDPNLRKALWKDLEVAKKEMLWGIEQADIVKISDDEVDFLFSMDIESALHHIFEKYNLKLLTITCGENGSYYIFKNGSDKIETLKDIKVKDTTGAGDIFAGSLVYKLLSTGKEVDSIRNEEMKEIVNFASKAASLSTEKTGAMTSIPSILEITSR